MKMYLRKLRTYIELLNKLVDAICNFLLVVMVSVIIVQVFFRYIVNSPVSWSEEVALLILIWFGLLSVSTAIYRHSHMSITFLWEYLPLSGRNFLDAIVQLLIFIFSLNIMLNSNLLVTLVNSEVLPASGILRSYLYLAPVVAGALMAINSSSNLLLGNNNNEIQDSTLESFIRMEK
jgi:TRAP-type C4-dicarboxylate transport system permease small subunit